MSVHVVLLSICHLRTVTSWIDSTINYLLINSFARYNHDPSHDPSFNDSDSSCSR
ncbi:unnamed protein product [Brassica rapa subsp. narinosa]